VLQAANKPVSLAKGQRITGDGPNDGHQAHHGEALHHGGQDVLLANQAAVEEGQAGSGHQQDQSGGDQHPGIVAGGLSGSAGGLRILDGLLESGDLSLRGWRGGTQIRSHSQGRGGNARTADRSSILRVGRHICFHSLEDAEGLSHAMRRDLGRHPDETKMDAPSARVCTNGGRYRSRISPENNQTQPGQFT